MPPSLAGLLGVLITLAVVALIVGVRRGLAKQRGLDAGEEQLLEDLFRIVDGQPGAGMLVGAEDEVLCTNQLAEASGLSRGTRVGSKQLLKRVRQVRETLESQHDVTFANLVGSIVPLGAGRVLVLGEDKSASRRAAEARRDFLTNVSHELKTPVGAIAILAEAVGTASDDPATVQEFAGKLQRESSRLGDLVGQIIDLSRLQSSGPPAREVVSVEEAIDDAVARSRVLADSRNVNLVVAPTEPMNVLGDHWQLVDALRNLIDNAVSYSDRNARVAISATTSEEDGVPFVHLAVADNGIGIAKENLERVFERFYRVDDGRSREHGGTGLGLSIVRQVAEIHDGSVTVWSLPKRGSTFTIHLPRYLGGVPGSIGAGS